EASRAGRDFEPDYANEALLRGGAMNLSDLSIRRPIFITCVVLVMLVVGVAAMQKLGVDLFPDVNFPIVTVTIPYPGAGPSEIETLVSKPVEDEVSTISGIKRVT